MYEPIIIIRSEKMKKIVKDKHNTKNLKHNPSESTVLLYKVYIIAINIPVSNLTYFHNYRYFSTVSCVEMSKTSVMLRQIWSDLTIPCELVIFFTH